MSMSLPMVRIGVCGADEASSAKPVQYLACRLSRHGRRRRREPVVLGKPTSKRGWADMLRDIDGVVYAGNTGGWQEPMPTSNRCACIAAIAKSPSWRSTEACKP